MAAPAGSFRFVFTSDGKKLFNDTLGIAADAVKDWRPAFDEIHQDFYSRAMPQWFGSWGQGTWHDYYNEPRYEKMKRGVLGKPTGNLAILRWTKGWGGSPAEPGERLYPSLVDPTHREHVYNTTKYRFSFGTKVPLRQEATAWRVHTEVGQRDRPCS